MAPLPPWLAVTRDGILVRIAAQPGARKPGLAGLHGDRLKVKVAAPPVDGAANAAIESFFAELLGIGRRYVRVHAGQTSRRKDIIIAREGDPAPLLDILLAAVSASPSGRS